MRLTIVAGVIMGVALAIQSALGAHARAKVAHPATAGRVHERAPWYVAMNDGHSAGHSAGPRGTHAGLRAATDQTVLIAPVEASSAGPTKSNASHPRSGSTRLTCTIIGI